MDLDENQNNEEKKNNEGLFSFSKLNKYYIFPFLCPLACIILNVFITFVYEDKKFQGNQFLASILICFSYFFGGIFYTFAIRRKLKKGQNKEINNRTLSSSSIELIYNENDVKDIYNRNVVKIYLLLLIMSILLALFFICGDYFSTHNILEERFYFFIFIPLFSYYILKYKIYNHHILSLLIAFIGFILILLPVIFVIKKDDIIINICLFLASFGYSIFSVLIKYLNHYYYISTGFILITVGFLSFIITFIYFTIYSLIVNHNLTLITNNYNYTKYDMGAFIYFYIFMIILSTATLEILIFFSISYFNPTLLLVTDIIAPMILYIIRIFKVKDTKLNMTLRLTGYSFVLISAFVYNEFIIFNFWGLNTYTKKFIEKRQYEELYLIEKKDNSNASINEEETLEYNLFF